MNLLPWRRRAGTMSVEPLAPGSGSREQSALIDDLLRQLARKTDYIADLEAALALSPAIDLDAELEQLMAGGCPPPRAAIRAGDLARLRALFRARGLVFEEPPQGLSLLEEVVWMMQWIVEQMLPSGG